MTPADEHEALRRDEADPGHRDLFHVPPGGGAYAACAYLAGNSLGLQPKSTADELVAELAAWQQPRRRGALRGRPSLVLLPRVAHRAGRPTGRRAARRGGGDELAHRQPPPPDGVVLPTDRHPPHDSRRGHDVPVGQLRRAQPSRLSRIRPGHGGRAPGHRRPQVAGALVPRARRRHGCPRVAGRGQLPHRRAARHPGDHVGRPCRRGDRRLGSSPCGRERPVDAARLGGRLRRLVLVQVPQRRPRIGRRGVRSRTASRRLHRCRASRAGGATTRRRASRWRRSPGPRPAPTPGRCPTRRSWR